MPLLSVKDLSFSYANRARVLDGVNFQIARGERVALLGPNGAGKSTLLWHLNALLPERAPSSSVELEATPLSHLKLPEIRRRVGLVFQDPDDQLFCSTIGDDVAFGPRQLSWPKEKVAETVTENLARVGLVSEQFSQRRPQELSTGEKRRACIAGVLACQPELLVLDEPTANLSPRGRRELATLLRSLPMTQLIATHDLEFAETVCEKAILLADGRIQYHGPLPDLFRQKELLARFDLI